MKKIGDSTVKMFTSTLAAATSPYSGQARASVPQNQWWVARMRSLPVPASKRTARLTAIAVPS